MCRRNNNKKNKIATKQDGKKINKSCGGAGYLITALLQVTTEPFQVKDWVVDEEEKGARLRAQLGGKWMLTEGSNDADHSGAVFDVPRRVIVGVLIRFRHQRCELFSYSGLQKVKQKSNPRLVISL